MKEFPRQESFLKALEYMGQHGSSVTVNWGEDTGAWEVSWITDGKRYTGVSANLQMALIVCVNNWWVES